MSRVRLHKRLFLLVLVTLLSVSTAAQGQSARQLLAKGNKLFASGDYQGAFGAFERGNTKRPSPAFLRSMAFCKMKLYEHQAAADFLTQFLKKYPKAKDLKKLRETLKKLSDVIQTTLAVASTPPGADIYIDAEAGGKVGKTPKTMTIEPGTHTVILRKAGFAVTTKTVAIKARQKLNLSIALDLPLRVVSTPPGAEVFVDSLETKPVGKTPLGDATIAPGKHTVYVRAKGYQVFEKTLDVKSAVKLTATLALGLRVDSVPAGATVSVDGAKVKGLTPTNLGITPGSHKITLRHAGFKDYEKTVAVAPGVDASFKAVLRGGLLTMRTTPAGASVMAGTVVLGKTPLTRVAVPMGRISLHVTHPGRRPWEKAIAFDDTTLVSTKLRLGAPSWPFWALAGTAAAAAIGGGIAGGIALGRKSDFHEREHVDAGLPNGNGIFGKTCNGGDCPYGYQDATTGLLVTAGVLGAASALYYLAQSKYGGPTWPFWALAGTTAAAGILGTVFGIVAMSKKTSGTT
ncbi:MAG: PEGA domain-containing protein, partial [Deltaproteobacteria bacterium]|nr:PEGA domain-containing protein [Deltaproteobacteria bacterium]